MSGNFLPAARKLVFLGEAGCGKSEIAMQLALTLAAQGGAVHFFDLDQTKSLMRARDAAALLEAGGVTVHFAEQYADIPTQTGGLLPLLMDESAVVLLDVGGGDTGAKLIGGYAHLLRTAAVYFVVNPYRPWSGTAAHIDGTLSAVLRASRLRTPRFLLNPNLGRDTTAEEYLDGLAQGLALLTPHVAVEAAAVPDALYAQVRPHTGLPLLRITPRQGAIVNTPDGRGQVVEANLLTGAIKVRLEKAPDSPPALYRREDVKVIRDGRGRPQREAAEPAGDAE